MLPRFQGLTGVIQEKDSQGDDAVLNIIGSKGNKMIVSTARHDIERSRESWIREFSLFEGHL